MIEHEITALGDSALTIVPKPGPIGLISSLIAAEAGTIERSRIPGVTDVVASYESITVHYDPLRIGYSDLKSRLLSSERTGEKKVGGTLGSQRTHNIPVRYDGEDLEEVATRTGLTTDEVIAIHMKEMYTVLVIGFVPGFAYLGQLDPRLVLPRRESPRKRVPPGSVAIAEAQTGIYPSATPGGWHLIGTTTAKLFNPDEERPARFIVGDHVQFVRK
jgi:KipI family sensor histidine kinase inhibitor